MIKLNIERGPFDSLRDPEELAATRAAMLFEELLIPEHVMPDSPEVMRPEYDEIAPLWAQIGSCDRQAEEGIDPHHTWEYVQEVALAAAAKILRRHPFNDVRVDRFTKVVGLSPDEFLRQHGFDDLSEEAERIADR